MDIDSRPVPPEQELACILWQCHHLAVWGLGDSTDDSVNWWSIQPLEREIWMKTADRFLDVFEYRRRWF